VITQGRNEEVRLPEFCKIECGGGGGSSSDGCHACQRSTVAALFLIGQQCNSPLHPTTENFLNVYFLAGLAKYRYLFDLDIEICS
jgi:hypothetical protein